MKIKYIEKVTDEQMIKYIESLFITIETIYKPKYNPPYSEKVKEYIRNRKLNLVD